MNRCSAVVTLSLWPAFAAARADAQEEMPRLHDSSRVAARLTFLDSPDTIQHRPAWLTSARFPAGRRASGVLGAQAPRNPRPERGVGRKVFGALVGAAGGFFAGGYLGAAIEGDRCHCDDPGLKGAVIGAPVGAAAGGILGWRYLF